MAKVNGFIIVSCWVEPCSHLGISFFDAPSFGRISDETTKIIATNLLRLEILLFECDIKLGISEHFRLQPILVAEIPNMVNQFFKSLSEDKIIQYPNIQTPDKGHYSACA